ncbi:MAG: hypothetical protein ACMXX5_02000, partial [Candidatus Woesearchaeota archaeon]
ITGLRFFGVIDTSATGRQYCSFPSGFECSNLVVRPLSIQFDLKHTGEDIFDLRISSSSADCEDFTRNLLKSSDGNIQVLMSCKVTAGRNSDFRETLNVRYSGGGRLSVTNTQARIRTTVS